MKIFGVILGIVVVAFGLFCALSPGATYLTLGWIVGAAMLFNAVGNVMSYSDRRALGMADGWTLAGAILSILFAVLLMFSGFFRLAIGQFFAVWVGIWLFAMGALRIITTCKILSIRRKMRPEDRGRAWLWTLISGILMVILGFIGFFNPISTVLTIGMLAGIFVIVAGITMITSALTRS